MTESAIRAQKRRLRHLFRTAVIAKEAICQVDQRTLPAAHNPLKGIGFASQDFFNVSLILTGAQKCLRWYDLLQKGTVAFFFAAQIPTTPAKETQPIGIASSLT